MDIHPVSHLSITSIALASVVWVTSSSADADKPARCI